MEKERGITMVSLVVTIIICIILAGISIQVTIGEDGIITKAKQAKQNITLAGEAEAMQLNQLYYELETGGEMSEDEESSKKDEIIALLQKQVEELQKQVTSLQTENAQLQKQIQDLSTQIANLQKEIEDLKVQIASKDIEIANLKKQVGEKEAKIQDLQNQLNQLNSLLAQTNSTADKILSGYKAYSGGKLLTGTMSNNGALNSSLNCGQSYTVPAGYTSGGKITANSLASQTVATATANNISNGVTAWVNGVKITGNGTDVQNSYQNGYNQATEIGSALDITNFSWIGCYDFHQNEQWHTVTVSNATNYQKLYYIVMFRYTTGGGYAFRVEVAGGAHQIVYQNTAIQQGLIEPTQTVTIKTYYNQQAVHANAYIIVMGKIK